MVVTYVLVVTYILVVTYVLVVTYILVVTYVLVVSGHSSPDVCRFHPEREDRRAVQSPMFHFLSVDSL